MSKLYALWMSVFCFLLVACTTPIHQMRDYVDPNLQARPHTILQGEVINVAVLGQADLTRNYRVDDRGNISMPLLHTIYAYGKTPVQLAAHIRLLLAQKYIKNPSVSVEMVTYQPIWVTGAVRNSAQYAFLPGMTAEAAIIAAGGFVQGANKTIAKVTRHEDGRVFEANVLLQTPLAAGDIVRVYGNPNQQNTGGTN